MSRGGPGERRVGRSWKDAPGVGSRNPRRSMGRIRRRRTRDSLLPSLTDPCPGFSMRRLRPDCRDDSGCAELRLEPSGADPVQEAVPRRSDREIEVMLREETSDGATEAQRFRSCLCDPFGQGSLPDRGELFRVDQRYWSTGYGHLLPPGSRCEPCIPPRVKIDTPIPCAHLVAFEAWRARGRYPCGAVGSAGSDGAPGSRDRTVTTLSAMSTSFRFDRLASSRSIANAACSSRSCRSMRMPFARSVTARRAKAPSRSWYSAKRCKTMSMALCISSGSSP